VYNLAVVIVNYNDSKRIRDLVKTLKKYNIFKKIIISDNNSSDDNKKIIHNLQDSVVKVIFNNENLGFSGANNTGLEYLKKCNIDYVFTINSDVMVSKKTIINSVKFLIKHEDISLVSAIMNEYGEQKQCYYNFPTVTHSVAENLGIIKLFHLKPKVIEKHEDYIICDYIRSSYWCVRFKDFERIGFFDKNTFLYHVETCVGIKLSKARKKCAILTNETYEHNHIYKKGYKIKGYKETYKSLVYIFKNYYNKNCFELLCLKISYELGLFIRFIFRVK